MNNSNDVFKNYADYYDVLYKDKDYDAEVKYIHNLIKDSHVIGSKIIEFGSGTGIHANQLTKFGYDIEGIELSKDMVSLAKTSHNFNIFEGDMIHYKSKDLGTFDIALSLFHVVSYLTKNKDLERFFKNAYEHLKKDGILIFDVWYTEAVHHTPPEVRIKKMSDSKLEIIRIAEPQIHDLEKVVDVNFTIFSKYFSSKKWDMTKEKHPMRHFSVSDIQELAKINKFKILKKEEFLTSNPLSQDSWGACFVLQK